MSCIVVQLLVQWTVQQRFIGNEGKEEQTILNQFAFSTSLPGHPARIDIHHKNIQKSTTKHHDHHRAFNRARICTQFCHYILNAVHIFVCCADEDKNSKKTDPSVHPKPFTSTIQINREEEKTDTNSKLTNDRAAFPNTIETKYSKKKRKTSRS